MEQANHGELRALRVFAPALALLSISLLVNYVDRGNLSIAAPLLKKELGLSATQLGILLSAFFWTYTALQFAGGWIVGRFEVNLVLAGGYLLWSAATAATGLVQGFLTLLMMRLLLGIGESVAFPAVSKILARHLPEQVRGFANGSVMAGMKAGPAVGTLGAGLLMAKYGWRPVFIGIGLVSLLWLPAWSKWMPRGEGMAAAPARAGQQAYGFVLHRSFWGASLGHFGHNYISYFMLTWLPYYLVHERHLTLESVARLAGLYYAMDSVTAIATGWVADFFIRRGQAPTVVRKAAMAIGHTTAALAWWVARWRTRNPI